jgi:predicted adenylyl cyclase CyaB
LSWSSWSRREKRVAEAEAEAEAEDHVTDPLEIEVKVRYPDAASALRAIVAAGGRESRARHFEENFVLDTVAGDLVARSALLRVRRSSDGEGFLTFKEKVVSEVNAKVRREWETRIEKPEVLLTILEGAGFVIVYRYQKYRTVFALEGATVDLDETPMGCFIEIEAAAEAIPIAAARLGVAESEFIVEDYRALYREWLEARGRPFADMVFEDAGPGGPRRP